MYQVGNIVNDNLQGGGVVVEITTHKVTVRLSNGKYEYYNVHSRNVNSKSTIQKRTRVTTNLGELQC